MRTRFTMLLLLAPIACLQAQTATPANPLMTVSKGFFEMVKGEILASANKLPETSYSFKPTPEVRSYGEILAHIAGAQYEFCGILTTGKPVMKDFEKTAKTKADIVAALNDGFGYCESAFASLTDADAPTMVDFFGHKLTKLGVMDVNTAHMDEHYGNLVTYMRIKGVVPPSSEKGGM